MNGSGMSFENHIKNQACHQIQALGMDEDPNT